MRRFFLSAIVAMGLVGLSGQAQAFGYGYGNDGCCNPCDSCCCNNFDGFYVGGNLGAFSHTAHRNDYDGFFTDNSGWSTVDTNVTAGLQLGYDWNWCNKLLGLVVDWNWVNIDHNVPDDPNGTTENNFVKSDFDWFTTIRARLGFSVCDAIVYVTGGAAVARFETRWQNQPITFNHHHTRWGWTAGIGTEVALFCNWSLGAEVLFLNFQEQKKTFTFSPGNTFTFGNSDTAFVGRVVLNYRFGDLFGRYW